MREGKKREKEEEKIEGGERGGEFGKRGRSTCYSGGVGKDHKRALACITHKIHQSASKLDVKRKRRKRGEEKGREGRNTFF